MTKNSIRRVGILVSFAAFIVLTGCDRKQQQAALMDDIYKQVVDDAVAQYAIVRRRGNEIDLCVHAGLVAAAYLQARGEKNYTEWKRTERINCESAGVPLQ